MRNARLEILEMMDRNRSRYHAVLIALAGAQVGVIAALGYDDLPRLLNASPFSQASLLLLVGSLVMLAARKNGFAVALAAGAAYTVIGSWNAWGVMDAGTGVNWFQSSAGCGGFVLGYSVAFGLLWVLWVHPAGTSQGRSYVEGSAMAGVGAFVAISAHCSVETAPHFLSHAGSVVLVGFLLYGFLRRYNQVYQKHISDL